MRDHGGDLARAQGRYGKGDWIDLSTGINPVAYPMPALPPDAFSRLPGAEEIAALQHMAQRAYGTSAPVVALSGAQAAIQLVPRLRAAGTARVLGPTYNEHAAALAAQGWQVDQVQTVEALAGADLAVVVNPNNPDGRILTQAQLLALRDSVGLLVVDESFIDVRPDASITPHVTEAEERVVVLRSFGKFYGLAGLRLGFAVAGRSHANALRDIAGPWAVNGPALVAGGVALADTDWQWSTRARLTEDAARLDGLAAQAGWRLVGGTTLFRTYQTPDAAAAQDRLARAHVWSRIFPYSGHWLRLGLPAPDGWGQLERAVSTGKPT
ncbi:Threonine-phosphate decarboxylase [Roseibaca ekhonensis]|uniref:threonine-phosphate decarboxylase n=1 Tax=Roseinatronobacter ekhonensis TaxID=254356 RepID=A0A3B0MPQ3_9RHOB|nr:threonine-phosphate decarboxylase CobD [Roseibaca ekhonensis]SUZ32987.1 Threonine-phosphate decarboxylase [Roseibaca ekhonensis]